MYRNRERNGADDPNELGMCIHDLQRRNGSSNILSLLPTLDKEKDVLIMDNMRSHHAKQVQAVLAAAGVKVLFLPPYSPDLNPIERLWSKMKAILRHEKIRSVQDLPSAVAHAFSRMTVEDCLAWFHLTAV